MGGIPSRLVTSCKAWWPRHCGKVRYNGFRFSIDLDVLKSPASGSDLHKHKKWLQKVKV